MRPREKNIRPRWNFARKLPTGSLGGESHASSEMINHMSLLREFYESSLDLSPGAIGFEDCGNLFIRQKEKMAVAE